MAASSIAQRDPSSQTGWGKLLPIKIEFVEIWQWNQAFTHIVNYHYSQVQIATRGVGGFMGSSN